MKPENSDSDEDIAPKKQEQSFYKNSKKYSVFHSKGSKFSAMQCCVFGTCLDHLMISSEQTPVPYILCRLCNFIESYGLSQQSLFKEPEEKCVVQVLKKEFNEYGDASLELIGDAPAASILLKLFFEELPEPLIPASMQSDFVDNMKKYMVNSDDCVRHLKILVGQLPLSAFCVLKYLSHFLLTVANHGNINGLSCANLGIIFGPIIFRSSESDPSYCITVENITHCFVADYFSIFEGIVYTNPISSIIPNGQCDTKVTLLPSSIMSEISMMSLKVFIPPAEDLTILSQEDQHTPVLLIEHFEKNEKAVNEKGFTCKLAENGLFLPSKKCKGCSSKVGPCTPELCNSVFPFHPFKVECEFSKECQSFYYLPDMAANTKHTDCAPIKAQQSSKQEEPIGSYFKFLSDPLWKNSLKPAFPLLHCSSNLSSVDNQNADIGQENKSLDNGWNALFQSEEPVRSHPNYSWSAHNANEEIENDLPSQKNQILNEAPLSPSAYRSYLTFQSSHSDSSIAPSPPTNQECFENLSPKQENSMKQLTKRIHGLKKKILNFEEKYEREYGYKPSYAEKVKFSEGKKLLSELHKARKDIKYLKEVNIYSDSCTTGNMWSSTSSFNVLEDTTNCIQYEANKSIHYMQNSLGDTIKSLYSEKKSNPESFQDTICDARANKCSTKKVPVNKKNISNKQSVTAGNVIKPFSDQHHKTKLLKRSCSFPVYASKNIPCKVLQPIMEHETMDFSFLQNEKRKDGCCTLHRKSVFNNYNIKDLSDATPDSFLLDVKYNNTSLHELPLSEMICQRQYTCTEKKRLRKILREFETEFLNLNGRKVQKDDKAPVDALYSEYKLVKARLRLLEALISKHHQHIFI